MATPAKVHASGQGEVPAVAVGFVAREAALRQLGLSRGPSRDQAQGPLGMLGAEPYQVARRTHPKPSQGTFNGTWGLRCNSALCGCMGHCRDPTCSHASQPGMTPGAGGRGA